MLCTFNVNASIKTRAKRKWYNRHGIDSPFCAKLQYNKSLALDCIFGKHTLHTLYTSYTLLVVCCSEKSPKPFWNYNLPIFIESEPDLVGLSGWEGALLLCLLSLEFRYVPRMSSWILFERLFFLPKKCHCSTIPS